MEKDNIIKEDYPQSWSFETFNNLPNKTQRLKYANEHLKKLGCGSSRCAYLIDGEKVLKVANKAGNYNKGTAQNRLESQIGTESYFDDLVTQVYDYDDDYKWIEVEKAEPIRSAKTFEQITGYPFDAFLDFLFIKRKDVFNYRTQNFHTIDPENKKYFEQISEDGFADELAELFANFRIGETGGRYGDYAKLSHYGVVDRGNGKQIVLIDYGLDDDIFKEFYR